jgi:hypothetical protein
MCRGLFATDDKFSKHMKGLKTGGRQKGTPNKITAENREFLSNLFSENYELIQQDFLNLDSYQRCMVITKILPYILPKMQPVSETEEQKRAAEQLRLYSNIADKVFFWEQQRQNQQNNQQPMQQQPEQHQPEQQQSEQLQPKHQNPERQQSQQQQPKQQQPKHQEQELQQSEQLKPMHHDKALQQQEIQQNETTLKTSTLDRPAPVIRALRHQPPHRPFYASVPQKRRKH